MLYLLALQDLTKCPFRAVDEINQVREFSRWVFGTFTGVQLYSYFIFIHVCWMETNNHWSSWTLPQEVAGSKVND